MNDRWMMDGWKEGWKMDEWMEGWMMDDGWRDG